jgi:hypothetical protein
MVHIKVNFNFNGAILLVEDPPHAIRLCIYLYIYMICTAAVFLLGAAVCMWVCK